MKIQTKDRSKLIVSSSFISIIGLLMIALGLLYYSEMETRHIEQAQAMVLPKEYLKVRANEEGLNYKLLNKIISCESHWRMVKNAKSSAFGYFQILDKTEKGTPQYKAGFKKEDPYANIEMGLYLYKRYGTSPWNESKKCWRWYK